MHCAKCKKEPKDITEYVVGAKVEGYNSPDEFVRAEEGTYNHAYDVFYCTDCYIKIGMPAELAVEKTDYEEYCEAFDAGKYYPDPRD